MNPPGILWTQVNCNQNCNHGPGVARPVRHPTLELAPAMITGLRAAADGVTSGGVGCHARASRQFESIGHPRAVHTDRAHTAHPPHTPGPAWTWLHSGHKPGPTDEAMDLFAITFESSIVLSATQRNLP